MNNEYDALWQAMKTTKYSNTLNEVKKRVDDAKDVDGVLKCMLKAFTKAAHAEASTLWYYDKKKTGLISPRAFYGEVDIKDVKLNYGDGVVGNVIKTNSPVLISKCALDPRWNKDVDKKTGFQTESMICVPLNVEGYNAPFGALQILNKADGDLFDVHDLELSINLSKEMVRLFVEKADKQTFELLSHKYIDIRLDETINLFNAKLAKEKLTKTLADEDLTAKEKKKVIEHFLEIYNIINK